VAPTASTSYAPRQRNARPHQQPRQTETDMNEDIFNMELRKFLKKVGVTSQREIEQATRTALDRGALKGKTKIKARMTLEVEDLAVRHEIESDISLE
jgi:hypothetical protein